MKTDAGVSANQRSRARAMRGAPTDSELRLWRLLRDRRLNGIKFRRQVPVGPYIVDFLCVGAKLMSKPTGPNTPKAFVTMSVTVIWRTKAGKCFASGTTRCCRIAKGFWRQFTRMQDPHPALRATFSPREKGAERHLFRGRSWVKRWCWIPFSLGEKVARRRRNG